MHLPPVAASPATGSVEPHPSTAGRENGPFYPGDQVVRIGRFSDRLIVTAVEGDWLAARRLCGCGGTVRGPVSDFRLG